MSSENRDGKRLSVRIVPEGWDEYVEEERTKGLDPRLSRLREIARPRLNFHGVVILHGLSPSGMTHPELFYAQTSTNPDGAGHIIEYNKEILVEDFTFFHEFCHVKINEVGFKIADDNINGRAGECFDSDELWSEIALAKNSVSEIYANYLLYRYFEKESESLRDAEDRTFGSAEGTRRIVQEYGFNGVANIAGHLITRKWLGYEVRPFRMALKEALNGIPELRKYSKLNWIMSRLPCVREDSEIQQLTNVEIESIVECVWRIFKLKTGLDWRNCW